jgi:hypothetical protein
MARFAHVRRNGASRPRHSVYASGLALLVAYLLFFFSDGKCSPGTERRVRLKYISAKGRGRRWCAADTNDEGSASRVSEVCQPSQEACAMSGIATRSDTRISGVGNRLPWTARGFGETSCGQAGIQLDGDLSPETSISGGPLGHFVFMSGTDLPQIMTGKRGKGAVPVPSYCTPLDSASLIHVHGSVAKLYQCANSRTSSSQIETIVGHTLLVWNDAGITYEVSFHGHSQVNADLDVAVANATVLVPPRKR